MFELIDEHPTHFTAHNGKGEFKIAKKGLTPGKAAEFQKLCRGGAVKGGVQKLADGGDVRDPIYDPVTSGQIGGAGASPDTSRLGRETAPPPSSGSWLPPGGAAPPEWLAGVGGGPDAAPGGPASQNGQLGGMPAPPPQPAAPLPAPAAVTGTGGAPGPYNPGQLQVGGMNAQQYGMMGNPYGGAMGMLRGAEAMQERGIRGQADAASQAAKEQTGLMDQYAKVQQEHQAIYQQHLTALQQEHDRIIEDVQRGHIDPSRVWSSKSTGEKATAILGMILGGIGGGLTGQPNAALGVLQKTIDRDIDAQKSELGKKENLLSDNYRRTGNLYQAEQLTRLQMSGILEGQMKAASLRSGSAQAQAQATQAIGQARSSLVGPMMQMAQTQAMYSMLRNSSGQPEGYLPSRAAPPTGSDPTNPLKYIVESRKDASERTMIGPGGKPYLAYDKEMAAKSRPMLQAAQNVQGILQQMNRLRQTGTGIPGGDAANLYGKYRSALAEQWAMANGLTQPSEAMNQNLEHVMPSQWDAFARGKVTFEPIQRLLHERVKGIYESSGLHPDALPVLQLPAR